MSDHTWTEAHIATYLADGLTAQEAERLEAHVEECAECAEFVATSRDLERELNRMFADARPGPELEDHVVNRLRSAPVTPKPVLARWSSRAVAAAAAVVFLGAFGALASTVADGGLPMPGSPRVKKEFAENATLRNRRHPYEIPLKTSGSAVQDLTNEDPGLQSNLEAALPEIERVDRQTVDAAVTMDNLGQPNAPDTDTTALAIPRTRDVTLHTSKGTVVHRYQETGVNTNDWKLSGVKTPMDGTAAPPGSKIDQFGTFKPGDFQPSGVTTQPESKLDPKAPPPAEPKKDPGFDPSPEPVRRVILRSGNIEFEVPTFDAASATVAKLVNGTKGAFIATINSDKLPNGKVRGSITVRTPPEHLDSLVLDLRKELGKDGELKGVRLTSQDVTKQFTDTESRLRGARTMETRLLQIIKEGKGEIKQLLEAEKELGVWRTRIEEFEGELRYFSNLAALSTLTISLTEKEIRAAAGLIESERVQTGVEVEDVETAYQQLLKAITEAKGRVSKSELKQLAAGQFNASLSFETTPEAAGPIRDRLKQLGRVARLQIDRVQKAEGGTLPTDAKLTHGDTVFLVQLYNLANVTPRETATMNVAVTDVPAAYQALRDAIAKASSRVLNAQINEHDRQNITAVLEFDVKRTDEPVIRAAFDSAGEIIARNVVRAQESDNVTDSKVRFSATLVNGNRLKSRETTTLGIEVTNVDDSATLFAAQVAEVKGRQVDARFTRESSGKTIAKLVFEVPLTAAASVVDRFKGAGTVRASQSVRDPQATDGRFATARIEVTLGNRDSIVSEEDGLMSQVRRGLSYSATVLLTSVTWVVFGLCVVLPWAIIGYIAYRVIRRTFFATPQTTEIVPTPVAPPTATA